jgi:hypothetical protein
MDAPDAESVIVTWTDGLNDSLAGVMTGVAT